MPVGTLGRGHSGSPGLSSLSDALINCASIEDIRNLAPLTDEAQRVVDGAIVKVGRDRLVLVDDLLTEGLVFNLEDPLGTPQLFWHRQGKFGHAQRSMTPHARQENSLRDLDNKTLPIYATWETFVLGIRELRASQRSGFPLDDSGVQEATRNVNVGIEDAAINGSGVVVGGNTAPGLIDAPNVNTITYVDSESWTAAGHSGEDILDDVLSMVDALHTDDMFGPYNLYVNTAYGVEIENDFKANSDDTIRERLQRLNFGNRQLRVRVADKLPTDRTALVQMTSDVIDLVNGQPPIPISWEHGNGMSRSFMVLAFQVPRVKDNADDKSGICLGNV